VCGSREHDLPQVAIRAAPLDVRSTTACTWIGGDVEAHYLARHPIFDRAGVVVGYELLYRSGDAHNRADVVDDVQATMDVIYRSVVELGLEATVSAVPAWLNVTAEVLRRQAHQVFAPGSVVLEILESVRADDDVLELLDEVAAQGYTIALDDFVCGTGRDELVAHAAVVKLELPAIAPDDLAAQVAEVHRRGATALVEKIETHEQHALARAAGADLFQGYFFTKPQILATRSASPSTPALLALLAKVNDPDVELEDLSRLVTSDVALATKVIQGANSGFAGLRHRVDSVRQAVVLIGLNRMRQLVTLLVMARATDKPVELFRQALVRAEMAAGLVDQGAEGAHGPADRDLAFTAGLLSTVDAFTDLPLPDVVRRLGLSDQLSDALVDRAGMLGRVLSTALAYEDDDVVGHDPASIRDVYAAAVRRADERWSELAAL
jgi:EAL and modified HD-GYP domain-containing signal transduction protein